MKLMKTLTVAATITVAATSNAYAWGEKEQGALAGVFGTLILQNLAKGGTVQIQSQPQQYPQYQPQQYPQYKDSVQAAYERGLRARQEQERREAEKRAYECGYYGNC